MTLVLYEPRTESLDELAETANSEHTLTTVALSTALVHAFACGEALLKARELIAPTEWPSWVEKNLRFGESTATAYFRLAFYRDRLPASLFQSVIDSSGRLRQPSATKAMLYVRGLPPISDAYRDRRWDPDMVLEAKRLRTTGLSYQKIGEIMGFSTNKAMRICDPEYHAKQKKKIRELAIAKRAAVREAKRASDIRQRRLANDRVAKDAPGAIADGYALIRRAAQVLDDSLSTHDRATQAVVRSALDHLYKAEDDTIRALRNV